jgi:hypothetical protein
VVNHGVTKTVWGDATPLPADPDPVIRRRPAWTRVLPGIVFAAVGAVLFALDLAATPGVIAVAFVCIVGGLTVAALHLSVDVCSGCGRPIDSHDGSVVVAPEHTADLCRAVDENDTQTIVFRLTGVPQRFTGPHATVDLTWCRCGWCGTIGASAHASPGGNRTRLSEPKPIATPLLPTLVERSKL